MLHHQFSTNERTTEAQKQRKRKSRAVSNSARRCNSASFYGSTIPEPGVGAVTVFACKGAIR